MIHSPGSHDYTGAVTMDGGIDINQIYHIHKADDTKLEISVYSLDGDPIRKPSPISIRDPDRGPELTTISIPGLSITPNPHGAPKKSMDYLESNFRKRMESVLAACRFRGIEMRPYCCVRSTFDQARIWRSTRSSEDIGRTMKYLNKTHRAHYIAEVIDRVGPQYPSGSPKGHLTHALPGYSHHQWSKAIDCYWMSEGVIEWSTSKTVDGQNGYEVYAEIARDHDLEPGGTWLRLKDYVHVQANYELPDLSAMEISVEMSKRFPLGS